MNDETVTERVARGAAWLDENEPGRERRVDLARLDLKDTCRCVLGQVFAPKVTTNPLPLGINAGFYRAARQMKQGVFPEDLGFDATSLPTRMHVEYAALDEAWIALIKDRFDSGALSDEVAP